MEFKTSTINPKGRNKYGNYLSSGNISYRVLSYNSGGNTSTPDTPTPAPTPNPTPTAFNITLSKNQGTFEWQEIIPNGTQRDIVYVFGFKNMDKVPTFIGDISKSEEGANNDIKNIPQGMTIEVVDNGTSATTFIISVEESIDPKQGYIQIPVSIYTGNVSSPEGDDIADWNSESANCKTLWMEYNYIVLSNGTARWINTNVSQILYNPNNNAISPLQVEARVFKQEGNQNPVIDTATTIYWGWDTMDPKNQYIGPIPTRGDSTYLTLGLKNSDGVFYETLTIPVVKYGTDGLQGKTGASIRGPIDWGTVLTSRRFCNGIYDENNNASLPEDALYIDIVKWKNKTYRCITSFDFIEGDSWEDYEQYFEESDNYNFVATNLLLAENAKINFATNNELYLTDSQGNVTAGAAGGNGVNFWAGAPEPDSSVAAWSVDNAGNMIAKKGTFGTLEISENELGEGVILAETGPHSEDNSNFELEFNAKKLIYRKTRLDGDVNNPDYVSISLTNSDAGGNDSNAAIEISRKSENALAIDAGTSKIISGDIEMYKNYDSQNLVSPKLTRRFVNPVDDNMFTITEGATFSPIPGLRIVPITDDSTMFSAINGQWHFCGINLNVSSLLFPSIRKDQVEGYWEVYNTTVSNSLGIASSTTPKQNNCIYIKVDATREIWFGNIKIV